MFVSTKYAQDNYSIKDMMMARDEGGGVSEGSGQAGPCKLGEGLNRSIQRLLIPQVERSYISYV